MNVLSLFDGMSCGRIALDKAGISVGAYYASEIDKYAEIVSKANYPDIIRMGDITKWRKWDIDWSSIDLVLAGSPCQGFSFAGKQLAFDDPRSALFFEFVNILNHTRTKNPSVKFLLENVKMKKEHLTVISDFVGVQPVFINSSLVSAQNRQRYYWASWEFGQPSDLELTAGDIKQHGVDEKYFLSEKLLAGFARKRERRAALKIGFDKLNLISSKEKISCITARYYKCSMSDPYFMEGGRPRRMTPIECERAQTVLQYIKPVEIVLCLDQAKSFVSAVEKNPKLLKLVSSAGSEELKERAKLASQSTSASQALIKNIAPQSVDTQIRTRTKKCTSDNQGGLSLTASSVEGTTTCKQAGSAESSVIQSVFMGITEGRITHYGKEELPRIEQDYTERMNGKIALNLSGDEMMLSVGDALSALEMMQTNQHSISITSFRLSIKNLEQMLTISYWFAKSAIDGFTQDTMSKKTLYLNLIDGYTNHVSNTQRYKMLGNGWTVDVIAHILRDLK